MELVVYDITGRSVRSISVPRGQSRITWNGKDNNGNDVPSGIYFIALKLEDMAADRSIRKIVKLH
jgi:flagellar hook assembly protein FlgD